MPLTFTARPPPPPGGADVNMVPTLNCMERSTTAESRPQPGRTQQPNSNCSAVSSTYVHKKKPREILTSTYLDDSLDSTWSHPVRNEDSIATFPLDSLIRCHLYVFVSGQLLATSYNRRLFPSRKWKSISPIALKAHLISMMISCYKQFEPASISHQVYAISLGPEINGC